MAGPDGIRQARPTLLRRPQKLEEDRAQVWASSQLPGADGQLDHPCGVGDPLAEAEHSPHRDVVAAEVELVEVANCTEP